MNMKRVLAALLVLTLTLTLAGCGGFAGRMIAAVKKMEKVQSYRADLNLDAAITVTALGQEMPIDLKLSGTSDVSADSGRSRTDLHVPLFGEDLAFLCFTERTEDGYAIFLSANGGKNWTHRHAEIPAPKNKASLSALRDLASRFAETGVETIKGSEATVYAGTLTGEDLENTLHLSETLTNAFEAMELPSDAAAAKDWGDVPVTIAIDNKSGLVTRYTLDLTAFLAKLTPKIMDAVVSAVSEEVGLGGIDPGLPGFSLEIGQVKAEAVLYDFDAVGTIEIPQDALSAPEGSPLL